MPTKEELLAEMPDLRARLEEAEETLRAIRQGEVDALVVSGPDGEQIFTLKGADHSYRVMVESISEGTATLAPGGDILYANTRLAQILGLPLERVIGTSMGDYITEADLPRFAALTQSAKKEETPAGEFSLQAADGTQVPVYLSLSNLRTDANAGDFCLVVTDLTQQKRDAALLAEGRLNQAILAQAEQAIAVCDESGKIIKASHGLYQICDFNPLFMPLAEAFPLSFNSTSPVSLEPCFQGRTIHNAEVSFFRRDGKQIFLLINSGPLVDEQQRPIGCVVAFTDITERRRTERERQNLIEQLQGTQEELQAANEELMSQAEELQVQGEELRQSHCALEQRVKERTKELQETVTRLKIEMSEREQAEAALASERLRFFAVLEELPAMVCLLKSGYRVIFGNRYFRQIFGEVQPDRPCYEWCFQQDKPCEPCHSFDPINSGQPVEWEVTLENGRSLHIYDYPFTDTDGSPMTLEMGVDITARKQAEASLRRSEERVRYLATQILEAVEQERKRISMELHDDLGQSLLALRMQLKAMLREFPLEPALQQGLEESTGYLLEIINKVRNLSHALSPATLRKQSLTESVKSLLGEFQKYHDIHTEADVDEVGSLLPQGAWVGIYRILQEFLANVSKHAQATKVKVNIHAVEERVAVTMEDNGIGFDLEEVRGVTSRPGGLGLLSMEGRVEMLGGQLSLNSKRGRGTRLYFEIPQASGASFSRLG